MSRCLAVKGDHIPLVREREQHCMKGGASCPVLAAYVQRGQALDQVQLLRRQMQSQRDAAAAAYRAALDGFEAESEFAVLCK